MIKLRIEHHKTFIEEANSEELAFLKKALRIYTPVFNPQNGAPPFSTINLYYKKDSSFPTGYVTTILEKGKKQAHEFSLIDKRVYPKPKLKFQIPESADPLWINQEDAMKSIANEFVGTIGSATGTGKTRLIEETISLRGLKTLVIVPYRNIQRQVANRFIQTFGRKHVSTKAPKREKDEGDISGQSNETQYKRIGGSYKSESENTQSHGKKLGSSYKEDNQLSQSHGRKLGSSYKEETQSLSERTTHGRKLGSSYKEESQLNPNNPEDKYFEEKGYKKVFGKKNSFSSFKKTPKNKPFKIKKKPTIKSSDITVLCFSSLPETSLEFLESIECVIIDECHHSSAVTIREALDLMPKAAYRYGFSATPWRDKSSEHKLLLSALGENVIYELGGKEAVDMGIIAKPRYQVITSPTPDQWLQDDRNWRSIVEKGIVGNVTRNKTIVKKAIDLYENNHNVFICVDEIGHLEILQKRFQDQGIDVLIVHGEQKEEININNIKKIAETTKGLISIGTMAVGEGTDMPNISAVILASGGKASIRFLQRIGRGTRLTNGKNEVLVIDFEDWFNPTLLKHFRARKKIFNKYFEG